jgi:hypothetical protein
MKYLSIRVVEAEDGMDAIRAVEDGNFLDSFDVDGYDLADVIIPAGGVAESIRETIKEGRYQQ